MLRLPVIVGFVMVCANAVKECSCLQMADIAGSSDAVVVGELGQPLSIRCMAYGYPQPPIYWYRGSDGPIVTFNSVQYETRDNFLQIKKLSIDTLGKYSCQAYNGISKPMDWSITVKAYRNNEFKDSLFLVSRPNEVVTTPLQPQTEATMTVAPETEIPLYTASGSKMEGYLMSCNTSAYGCCPDGETPAHGSNFQGCCLQHEFGCCPDNYGLAEGPNNEGCGCEYARFGCCIDNITIARGPNMAGCGCKHSRYGCCPDRHTEAQGSEFIGCECHTYQFGCCPDGVTIASESELESCRCERSKYGCCGDETTSAKGPNMEGCDCSNSKYGCCPDGETEAKGDKFQNCSNEPVNKQAACALNHTQGTCNNYTALWFYDMEYGGCSQFWYNGCDGNANRFVSREECEDVCVRPSPKDTCNLPKVKASCDGYNVRWYYNSEREQCSQFVYGGCLGNANNFDTKEICEQHCEPEKTEDQCNLALERGPCAGHFVRWGFNAERRRCEQFLWGGCGGNHNRYDSEAACQLQCTPPGQPRQECLLPQDPGNCTEKHPVWSFNNTDNRCVPFYYSGCGGNDNRFNSEHSCDDSCPRAYVQEICTLPAMIGDCSDYTIKWFFNTTKKRCRQFYYGGCGGNENNFLSESECENQCTEQPTTTTVKPELLQPLTEPAVNLPRSEFCLLDIDKGPCTQSLPHWAYDVDSGACVQFQYGGCGGNRNNFPTLEYCERYCGPTSPPQDTCGQSLDPGNCNSYFIMWYYDSELAMCNQFVYGGCDGNDNRFQTQAECESRCKKEVTNNFIPITSSSQHTIPTTMAPSPPTDLMAETECATPVSLAPCGVNDTVYYFDTRTKACLVGDFGTCRYSNSYRTEEECQRKCGAFRLSDAVVVGELGQPLSIRCMAYGYPQPLIFWYRGSNGPVVPYSSVQYEARDNDLQIKKLSIDTLGKYSCQTYNGIGKPVDWSITVKAYRNNEFKDSLFLVPRQNEVVTTPRQPQTEATTTIAPEIKMFTVATRIVSERTRVAAGSELSLLCEVDGYPIPEVYWTKDSAAIPSDDRITVSETRLTVSRVNSNDTGVYGCLAFNGYNSHYSSVQISVEGLYIPPTCKDNLLFANCHLVVRSKFCSKKYYSSFCCKSCVEAGQLDVHDLQLRADDTLYRK